MEEPMMPLRRMDLIGTILAGLILAGGALSGFVGSSSIRIFKMAYVEVGDSELPTITRVVFGMHGIHLLEVVVLALLVGGIYLLSTIKDRMRANLYGALAGIALIGWSVTMLFAALIPLISIISSMGNQT